LDSCINQKFDRYEIIAVDNGSEDGSAAILANYSELYPDKVFVYTIAHAPRAGRPRNYGRSVARARYICYVDSDDELTSNALSSLYSYISNGDYDFVASPYFEVRNGISEPRRCLGDGVSLISKNQCNLGVEPAPWAKIFRASFLESVGDMPEEFSFEDLAWFFVYFTKANTIGYVNTFTYLHYIRSDSEVQGCFNIKITESVEAENYGLEFCNQAHRDLIIAHIAVRARINLIQRWMFSDYFIEHLHKNWSEISCNKIVLKNHALFDYLKRMNKYSKNLMSKIVYLNGFCQLPQPERIQELETDAFFGGCTVVVLSENNCDVTPLSPVYEAYKDQDFAFVGSFYAIKMIQRTGGMYVDDSIVLDVPFNFLRHLNAFFCSLDNHAFTTKLFGGKEGEAVFTSILATFQDEPSSKYSMAERIKTALAQEYNLKPGYESKLYAAQVSMLSPYVHSLYPVEAITTGSRVHLCHVSCDDSGEMECGSETSEIRVTDITQRVPKINQQNSIVVCLSSSNQYSAYCGAAIESIIENSNATNHYDIIILELDITHDNKRRLLSLADCCDNVSIRIINVKLLSLYFDFKLHSHFSLEGSLKLFLFSPLFEAYDKIVVLDSDLIVNCDIGELYGLKLNDNIMAACDDVMMKAMIARGDVSRGFVKSMPAGDYVADYLHMGSDEHYYNTGVVVFNLSLGRHANIFEHAMQKINSRPYWFLEQDVLNEILCEKIAGLGIEWNLLTASDNIDNTLRELDERTKDEYEYAMSAYNIVHFAGSKKPWLDPTVEYADTFFKYCRNTPWYEGIISKSITNQVEANNKFKQLEKRIEKLEKNIEKSQRDIRNLASSADRRLVKLEKRSPIVRLKYALNKAAANSASPLKRCYEVLFPRHTRRRELIRALVGKKSFKLYVHYLASQIRIFFLPLRQVLPWSIAFRYKRKIKQYRNKYINKRCFFIGNGPSLTPDDLNKLSDEYTFAFNRIFRIFDRTDWRPTFYMYQDVMLRHGKQFVSLLKENLSKYDMPFSFFPITSLSKEFKGLSNQELYLPLVENWSNYVNDKKYLRFSKNCSRSVHAAYGSMYTALQLAVYMGFREIYLIGTDCDYLSQDSHFYKDEFDAKKNTNDKRRDTDSVTKGFKIMKEAIDKIDGVAIYNATREGKLELFPRIDLEDVVMSKQRAANADSWQNVL
jgi:lipopolysaccharide biosynthesis glycosyltransferase/glycosyltransferase involved in cell wall biosynthesis